MRKLYTGKEIFLWYPVVLLERHLSKKISQLIDAWNCDSAFLKGISLKMVMVLPPLLLQKPSFKSTAKEHFICLKRCLSLWEAGECRAIQTTLLSSKKRRSPEELSKQFAKLMLQGKVNAASSNAGVLPLSDEVIKELKRKHPKPQPSDESVMIDGVIPFTDPAVFANIEKTTIAKAALNTHGAAGPSGLDAQGWRRILVSRNYGTAAKDLGSSVAAKLATEKLEIRDDRLTSIQAYLSCRLIPLHKNPGVRPIGVGEVLRRIIGKLIIYTIQPQIMESAGDVQLCASQQTGCKAAVHAMSNIFAEEETDALLLVDATNAFNTINREIMLHNIQYVCPPMSVYAYNRYATPSCLLFMADWRFRLLKVPPKELVSHALVCTGNYTLATIY